MAWAGALLPAACVALPVLAGVLSSRATMSSVKSDWYANLEKPGWQPPAWVFGPVWTFLYLAMGYAAWRAWKAGAPMGMYALQLLLNVSWSLVFFGMRNPKLALVNILGLLVTVMATAVQFYDFDVVAGDLMGPYVAWVAFATCLNAEIVSRGL